VEDTGLGFEFKRTMAFAGGGSFDRDFTPRLRGRIAYDVSHEDFGEPSDTRPSARSTLHTGSTQLAMLVAPRTRLGVDYMMRRLLGDDLRLRTIIHGEFTAHVLAARLTREVTPSLTVVLMAGPRVSQSLPTSISGPGTTALRSTIEPEALASLTYRRGDQRLSAAYTRSQFIGYGASGFVDTESIDVRAATVLANRVELSARPAIFRNSLLDVTARAYRVDAGVAVRVSRWLNIDGTYVHRYQDRTLTLADALSPGEAKARTRRSLMVGVSIRRSMRLQKSPGRDDDRPNVRNVP
jgi:hypothetical protein